MESRDSLQIAGRIGALLQHEIGEGIDGLRMLAEPLYARDVLLVCDALEGTEAPALARDYRAAVAAAAQARAERAQAAADAQDAAPASRAPGDSSGFGRSRDGASAFDQLAAAEGGRGGPVSGWRRFAPSRWRSSR